MVKGGACVAKGGMRGEGGCAWQRGACVACTPTRDMAGHCTGMHSCFRIFSYSPYGILTINTHTSNVIVIFSGMEILFIEFIDLTDSGNLTYHCSVE